MGSQNENQQRDLFWVPKAGRWHRIWYPFWIPKWPKSWYTESSHGFVFLTPMARQYMVTNQVGKQQPTSEALRRRKNPRCEPTFEPLRCCTAWRRPGRAESPTNRGTDGLPAALLKYCNNAREQSCPPWPPNARGHNSSLHACIMKREQYRNGQVPFAFVPIFGF